MGLRLAIVGRPNVGKSTLFNRLAGKRLAIVDDRPGVTRDRREGFGRIADIELDLIDTAGLEEADAGSLEARMRAQTERAVSDADVTLFLIDGRAGVMPLDKHFANWLRKSGKPVILAVNKCEGRAAESGLGEAYSLGLGDPIPLSAAHGEGLGDLYDALEKYAPPTIPEQEEEEDEFAIIVDGEGNEVEEELEEIIDPTKPLQVAIVGRPNVGKSTLINRIVGEDRLLTGPEAGITRDAITVEWEYGGRCFKLVDTAGMRRKATITDKLEKMSVSDTLRSIRMAEVVVLTMDANAILDKQDLTIARLVVDEGRALVIAINKWDAVDDKAAARQRIEDRLETSLPQAKGVPVVMLSALTGKGVSGLMDAIVSIHAIWNRRVTTSKLNRWLESIVEHHPPPAVSGRRVKLRYGTQIKSRPPTFVLFTSRPDDLPEAYMRYLVNSLRKVFELPGVPIRLSLRKSDNPYANK
jgi:GTP-binding protein